MASPKDLGALENFEKTRPASVACWRIFGAAVSMFLKYFSTVSTSSFMAFTSSTESLRRAPILASASFRSTAFNAAEVPSGRFERMPSISSRLVALRMSKSASWAARSALLAPSTCSSEAVSGWMPIFAMISALTFARAASASCFAETYWSRNSMAIGSLSIES